MSPEIARVLVIVCVAWFAWSVGYLMALAALPESVRAAAPAEAHEEGR